MPADIYRRIVCQPCCLLKVSALFLTLCSMSPHPHGQLHPVWVCGGVCVTAGTLSRPSLILSSGLWIFELLRWRFGRFSTPCFCPVLGTHSSRGKDSSLAFEWEQADGRGGGYMRSEKSDGVLGLTLKPFFFFFLNNHYSLFSVSVGVSSLWLVSSVMWHINTWPRVWAQL